MQPLSGWPARRWPVPAPAGPYGRPEGAGAEAAWKSPGSRPLAVSLQSVSSQSGEGQKSARPVMAEAAGRCARSVARLAWLGDSSYALYLIHWVILFYGVNLLLAPHSEAGKALVTGGALAGLCVLAGLGLHHGIEAPVIRALRSRLPGRRGAEMNGGSTTAAAAQE